MWLLFPLLMTGFRRRCLGWRCWCWKFGGDQPEWFKIREFDKDIGLQNSCIWNQEDCWNIINQCQMEVFISYDDSFMFNRYDSILRTIGSNMTLHVMFFWTSRIDWLMNGLSDWYFKCSQRADDHELVFEIVFLRHDMFGRNGWQGVQPT